jgi:hypothetical protein
LGSASSVPSALAWPSGTAFRCCSCSCRCCCCCKFSFSLQSAACAVPASSNAARRRWMRLRISAGGTSRAGLVAARIAAMLGCACAPPA